ncbi:MAG: hypothetical protein U0V56_10270 [Actinomycetota bacterium]
MLDRTRPGALGEPLYQDVVAALTEEIAEGRVAFADGMPRDRGRYRPGLEGVHPGDGGGGIRGRFPDEMSLGISAVDRSTACRAEPAGGPELGTEPDDVVRAVFFDLDGDGTSLNGTRSGIVGEHTDLFAQGYFVYGLKKAGSTTVSHRTSGRTSRVYATQSRSRREASSVPQVGEPQTGRRLAHGGSSATFLLDAVAAWTDGVWDRPPGRGGGSPWGNHGSW